MVTEILLLSPFPGKMHLNQLHTRVRYSCQFKKNKKKKQDFMLALQCTVTFSIHKQNRVNKMSLVYINYSIYLNLIRLFC